MAIACSLSKVHNQISISGFLNVRTRIYDLINSPNESDLQMPKIYKVEFLIGSEEQLKKEGGVCAGGTQGPHSPLTFLLLTRVDTGTLEWHHTALPSTRLSSDTLTGHLIQLFTETARCPSPQDKCLTWT